MSTPEIKGLFNAGLFSSSRCLSWPGLAVASSTVLVMMGFALALFARYQASTYVVPSSVMWLAACAVLLFTGHHRLDRGPLPWLLIAWLVWVASMALLFRVTPFSYFLGHILCVAPVYVLATMRPDRLQLLRWHMSACGLVLGVVALVAIYEWFGMNKSTAEATFLNRNNLAALLNVGAIVSVGLCLQRLDAGRLALTVLFGLALVATGSRGGMLSACIVTGIICFTYVRQMDWRYPFCFLFLFAPLWTAFWLRADITINTISHRLQIWQATIEMILNNPTPFLGAGLGSFMMHYGDVRIEHGTAGVYAHNDPMQFMFELGWPATLMFYSLCLVAVLQLKRKALIPFCAIAVVIIHTHISFHLYILPIEMALGLMLAWYCALTE